MRPQVQEAVAAEDSIDRELVEFRRAWEESCCADASFEPWRALAAAASLDGLWDWDLESNSIRYSDRCEELVGYARDEVPQTIDFFWSILHCEDIATMRAAISRCVENGAPTDAEFRLRTKRGQYRWFRARGQVQRDASGRALGIAGVLRDITSYKRAESILEDRLRFERMLADISATFVNASAERFNEMIEGSLQTLVEFLGNDRSTLADFTEDRKHVLVTHSCSVPGCEHFPLGPIADDRLPWYIGQLRRGNTVFMRHIPEDFPAEAEKEKQYCLSQGIQSNIAIPLKARGLVVGAITFAFLKRRCEWPEEIISRLQLVGEVFANALQHHCDDKALQAALAENAKLRDRLQQENQYLREQVVLKHRHGRIIGQSDALKRVLSEAERVAVTDTPVLILGETGTGKELLAQSIHELSARKDRPMVIVNCASLPATLIESELFGREAGAYTGAASAQVGRFVIADGSTLFLDEIGEFPIELQAKLLRVLQDGRFERLGSPQTVKVDVRVVAATNRDLEQAIKEGKFRADLYHRLNVFPLRLPPLRERREDIPLLVWAFADIFGRRMGKTIKSIPRKTMEQLQRYAWPGNVRELSNVIERAMILTTGDALRVELPSLMQQGVAGPMTLNECERMHILRVLQDTSWRIRGDLGAAEILGIKPTTLEARMAKLGIKRGKQDSNIS